MVFDVIGYVFIIIVVVRIFVEVFERIGYFGFFGEIMVGLMFGVFFYDFFREDFILMVEFGVFFFMMYVGLELIFEEVCIGGKKSFFIYVIMFVVMFFFILLFMGYRIGMDNFIVVFILVVVLVLIVICFIRFFG